MRYAFQAKGTAGVKVLRPKQAYFQQIVNAYYAALSEVGLKI